MEKKITNKYRYKQTASIDKKKRNLNKKLREINKGPKYNVKKIVTDKKSGYIEEKNKKKTNNIIICIILLIIIAILSRALLKEKNEPFFGNILNSNIEETNISNITVAVVNDNSLSYENTDNQLINELDLFSYRSLLKIDSDYNISYDLLKSIVKISNTEYVLNLKEDIQAINIKEALDKLRDRSSKYYDKLKNVKNIKEENSVIYIYLKEPDPTFIYNLNIPIKEIEDINVQKKINNNIVTYEKKIDSKNNQTSAINIKPIDTIEDTVNKYKEGEIDAFITSRTEIKTMLGKYEYNIKGIKTGKGIYLIGNKNSKLFSKTEVRKAIAYSIDRDYLIKEIAKNKAVKNDLPYIYDDPKYKYDIYAAENILLSAGYKKASGIYRKYEETGTIYLKLTLVVNNSDEEKLKIANNIKEDLENVGIGITIKKYSTKILEKVIENKEYDIALVTINTNENPSVMFLNEHININEKINSKIKELDNSNTNDVKQKINELKNTLSSEVAIIGIYSDISYYISRKDIEKFSNISYMNIFKELY